MSEFDDGKDADALRTIGEVSDGLGIKPHVLRYWEQQFPMLKPLKRSGGRRYYRPDDVTLVETIDRLVNREGYTLKGAKAAIRAGKGGEAGGEAPTVLSIGAISSDGPDLAAFLPQLKAIRSRLAAIIEA
jgi:DNA-binding transcriptional MerR regulator